MEEEKNITPENSETNLESAKTISSVPSQSSITSDSQESETVAVENSAIEIHQEVQDKHQTVSQEIETPSTDNEATNELLKESSTAPSIEKTDLEEKESKLTEEKTNLSEVEITSNNSSENKETKENTTNQLEQPQLKNFRRIIEIIIVIAVLIFFAWLINKESNTKDNSSDSNVNITVDGKEQNGIINIIDEVKGDVKVEDSSTTNIRPLSGYLITAYYLNTKKDPEMEDCSKVYELKRQGEKKYDSDIVNTVRGLLTALSTDEKAQGFSSAIPDNTFLQYVRIDRNGNAEVNFSGQIAKVAGSCAVTAIRAQITQTLLQFPNVKTVTICINGNCKQDEILQP